MVHSSSLGAPTSKLWTMEEIGTVTSWVSPVYPSSLLTVMLNSSVTTSTNIQRAVYYRPQGKVMFSKVFVHLLGDLNTRGVCLMDNPPLVTSSGGHCSSWYAFYWNAFLFRIFLPVVIGTMRIFQLYLDESEHCVT